MSFGNSKDSRAGGWDRGLVFIVLVIVAALCGAAAYFKGLS